VFLDELEALCPRRGGDSTGVSDRVVNQMLCYLDGVEARKQVFVLAATSRPDLVDPALMRPGRLEECVCVNIPTREEKLEILDAQARGRTVAKGVNLAAVGAAFPPEFCGADIAAVWNTAAIEARRSSRDAIETEDLFRALSGTKASISPEKQRQYERLYGPYRDQPTQAPAPMAQARRVALA